MKILVVDDHALVREGLRQVLKGLDAQVEVLEASHCARAFDLAALHPDLDLVLLDYNLPDMNGLEALAVFNKKHPDFPVVMLSGAFEPHMVRQVIAQGAAGFISKSSMSREMLSILRRILAGDVVVSGDLLPLPELPVQPVTEQPAAAPQITQRQEEVLRLLLEGGSSKHIGQTLHLSEETIKSHVSAIMRAFGVNTRLQVVLAAGRLGYTSVASSIALPLK